MVAGSSLVRMGNTQVLAVVTLQVGYIVVSSTTTPTNPSNSRTERGAGGRGFAGGGDVVITCSYRDLLSSASSSSSSSSVDPAMTSYLQRVVEENADLERLYIAPSLPDAATNDAAGAGAEAKRNHQPQAFRLCVGVEVLVDGGNVRDAALLACTSALADTRLPPTAAVDPTVDGDSRVKLVLPRGGSSDERHEVKRLSCPRLPVPLTVGLWDGGGDREGAGSSQLIVDPNKEEQAALSGIITVVVDAAAQGEACVVSTEMTGRADLTALALAVKLARGRAKELLPVLRP